MDQGEWNAGSTAQMPLPTLALRPLSTGELLDRVFFLYRARFSHFLILSLVPAVLGLLTNAMQQLFRPARVASSSGAAAMHAASVTGVLLFVSYVSVMVGYAVLQAATTKLVAQLYLTGASQPAQALRAALPRVLRYIGIELWKSWSLIWSSVLVLSLGFGLIAFRQRVVGGLFLFLALPAIVYGVVAYLRNSLAVPASVIENLPVRAAMRRSKALVSGRKWRIFLLYLLLVLLYFIAFAVQSPVLVYLAKAQAPVQHVVATALMLALSFVVALLISPVASIALCLFYFDERVRREAFDIDFLLRGPDAALGTATGTLPFGSTGASASAFDPGSL